MAFLDYTGLTRFWDKVKDYIASHSGSRGNAAIFTGTCNTAAYSETKLVVCPDYDQLVKGDIIYVTFSYTNTANLSMLGLNVNSTGGKGIKKYNNGNTVQNLSRADDIRNGPPIKFIYNGTYWIMDAATTVRARKIANEYAAKPFLVAERGTDAESDTTIGTSSYVYYESGKLYVSGYEAVTKAMVSDSITAGSTSMNVPTVHSVAAYIANQGFIGSNQGAANAGKFLVVNSSGVVEPVSMTAWQGGSY